MPLITCPDCQAQVSDAAPSCPRCGRPRTVSERPQVIEATGKSWKLPMVIGALMTAAGCFVAMIGGAIAGDSPKPSGGAIVAALLGSLAFLGGLAVFITARVGAWWHHG